MLQRTRALTEIYPAWVSAGNHGTGGLAAHVGRQRLGHHRGQRLRRDRVPRQSLFYLEPHACFDDWTERCDPDACVLLSPVQEDHPGGKKVLLKACGQDSTEKFWQFHSKKVLEKTAKKYLIGTGARFPSCSSCRVGRVR